VLVAGVKSPFAGLPSYDAARPSPSEKMYCQTLDARAAPARLATATDQPSLRAVPEKQRVRTRSGVRRPAALIEPLFVSLSQLANSSSSLARTAHSSSAPAALLLRSLVSAPLKVLLPAARCVRRRVDVGEEHAYARARSVDGGR
jgi:hypothetical protein